MTVRSIALAAALAAVALTGCETDVSTPGAAERTALLAPDFIAGAAAETTDDPQARWLLRQPQPVRESYVRDVLDGDGDSTLLATAWLLRQPASVRDSYVREVVDAQLRETRERTKTPRR